jgi:methyl-accepting chemotaxis protein
MFSIIIFFVALSVSTGVQAIKYNESKTNLEENLKSKASSILDFADVLLESRNEKFFSNKSSEVPQIIQNEIFDKFTEVSDGKVFFKEASNTPTNPKNLATSYEKEEIDFFKNNKDIKQHERKIEKEGKEYYMLSRPMLAEEKCIMCHPSWTTEGEVIAVENVLIDMEDFYAALSDNLWMSALLWLVNITILLTVIHLLFKKLVSDRIHKVLEIIFRVEKGNFVIKDMLADENIKPGSSQNEIDRIFRHLLNMVNGLKPVIDKVVEQSKEVVFESIYGHSKIKENLLLADRQTEIIDHSKISINNILDINNRLDSNLDEMLEKSENSVNTIDDGQHIVQKNLDSSSHASEAMQNTVNSIEELAQHSKNISNAIESITDIANETNLISLNAAIEAARAGEHGRGFAVVADKIRELADVSLENANMINGVLNAIHKNIEKVSTDAKETKEVIDQLNASSSHLHNNFVNINSAIVENSTILEYFKENFQNEKNALQEVTSNLLEVAKSSENLNMNSQTVEESVNNITNMSGELKNLTDGFDVIYNKRASTREVIVPPVKSNITISRTKKLEGIIYDISEHGVSMIVDEQYNDIELKDGERGVIDLNMSIRGKTRLHFEIAHIRIKKDNGTRQFGAKLI